MGLNKTVHILPLPRLCMFSKKHANMNKEKMYKREI